MPAQHFSLNEATAPLASVQWSAGFSTIDLTYNGTLLTRITDADSLRTTGMQGQTADGATLVLRLVPSDDGESFTLERNGARMHPSDVDQFALSPTAPVASPVASSTGSATPAQEKVMTSARRWIRAIGIFMLVMGFAQVIVSLGERLSIGGTDYVEVGDRYLEANSARVSGIVLILFGTLIVFVVRLARAGRAKVMFGVGTVFCFLLAALTLLSGAPPLAAVPAIVGARGLQAWKVAKAIGRPAAT